MTLGKSLSSEGILVKEIQLGWWLEPMRGSPLQLEVLGNLADFGPWRFLD